MEKVWGERFQLLQILFWLSLAGALLLAVGFAFSDEKIGGWAIAGFLLMVPFLFYGNIVVIWHWKARYQGKHSDLWGALILIETSGLFRLIYLLRHIVPDARRLNRDATSPNVGSTDGME